jgi:hypothetical protein
VLDNHSVLVPFDWNAQIFGKASSEIKEFCVQKGISLQVFPWSYDAQKAGFTENAIYLVRPDGYIGFTNPAPCAKALAEYFSAFLKD